MIFVAWCSFWKFVSKLDRRETRRYLQMFYTLMMRPLIAKVMLLAVQRPGTMTIRVSQYAPSTYSWMGEGNHVVKGQLTDALPGRGSYVYNCERDSKL